MGICFSNSLAKTDAPTGIISGSNVKLGLWSGWVPLWPILQYAPLTCFNISAKSSEPVAGRAALIIFSFPFLSNNSNIDTILCGGNKLTNLDISQNTSLIFLSCKDNLLRNLDLRKGNNINFTGFDATNNDSLYCISVNDSAWSSNNWTNIDSHTNFSNDCNPSTVDIIEIEKNLSVYPNPTSEEISISINNFNGNIQTEVYDLIGNSLQLTNKTTISLRDYSRGIYILNVAYGDKVEEVKVIKE